MASNANNMLTGDPGMPHVENDPAYVGRRYNTMPLPGVHPYTGNTEKRKLWQNTRKAPRSF
jgi:hypothetical protein